MELHHQRHHKNLIFNKCQRNYAEQPQKFKVQISAAMQGWKTRKVKLNASESSESRSTPLTNYTNGSPPKKGGK